MSQAKCSCIPKNKKKKCFLRPKNVKPVKAMYWKNIKDIAVHSKQIQQQNYSCWRISNAGYKDKILRGVLHKYYLIHESWLFASYCLRCIVYKYFDLTLHKYSLPIRMSSTLHKYLSERFLIIGSSSM